MQDDRHRQRLSKKACCIQFCVIAITTLQVGCSVSNITDKPAINAKNLSERLFSQNTQATRLSNAEIARSTEPVTAKVEGAVSGTGVITSREKETYKLLTAWHVIKPNVSGEQINIITHDGISHLAKPGAIERFGDIDLVELTFNSERNYQIANIGNPRNFHKRLPTGNISCAKKDSTIYSRQGNRKYECQDPKGLPTPLFKYNPARNEWWRGFQQLWAADRNSWSRRS